MRSKADKKGNGKIEIVIRKEEVVEGGHHGGSWKVAYADFVTAMMAFFLPRRHTSPLLRSPSERETEV